MARPESKRKREAVQALMRGGSAGGGTGESAAKRLSDGMDEAVVQSTAPFLMAQFFDCHLRSR